MNKSLLVTLLIVLATNMHAPAWGQEFIGYEGKNAISEGDGGAKKTVDGIDIWSDGAPPRRFQLLGYINDTRHKTGIWGKISMSNLDSDIADVAKKNGGDAVILMDSNAETIGTVGNAFSTSNGSSMTNGNVGASHWNSATTAQSTGTTTGFSAAVQKQHSKYAVVKYLKSEDTSTPRAPEPSEPNGTPAPESPPAAAGKS
jgi:hypothetical protein